MELFLPGNFSESALYGAAVAGLLLLSVVVVSSSWSRRRRKQPRYPPVAGTIFQQFLNFRRLHDFHTELSRRYVNYRLLSPFAHQLYTTDPAVVEYILKTNFDNFGKGLFNYGNLKDLFGDGIFAVDGDKWRHQRKLASFNFSTRSLRDFSGAIFKANAAKLAHVISSYSSSSKKFNIQDLFMRSAMDAIFKIAFGLELNSLDGSDHEGSEFAKAFDTSNEFIMLRYVNAFWKIMRFLNVGSEAALKRRLKAVDDFIYKVINVRVREFSDQHGNNPEIKEDILSKFLEESRNDPENIDKKYLRDIILNFVIAGKDTTAGTLSWFFYLICKNSSVQEKIYEEVKQVLLASSSADNEHGATFESFSNHISDESLNKMHYLHAALSETLRLFPAVPLENKVCFSDDVLPGGYDVRAGDIVFYQPYAMGRMEYLWGQDADAFRPERWLDADGVYQPESPFKFVAFQAGPRICLGKEFAYRQMKIFAAVLLRYYEFKLSDEAVAVRYRTSVTLSVDQGLHLEAVRR